VPPAARALRGRLVLPGDKSLSHRALILAALAGGCTELTGLNAGADVEATARVLLSLGVAVERRGKRWRVSSGGPAGWQRPEAPLDCGNSGTTMRVMAGVLAGLGMPAELRGDDSLSERPMGRIVEPLRAMGARIAGRRRGGCILPPLRLRGGRLCPLRHVQAIASAQVKSALLLAGWVAGVAVEVFEPSLSRDHTERMLRALGVRVKRLRGGAGLEPGGCLRPPSGQVPADPSAGAFFAAAAGALRGSDLTLAGVCLNRTRLGFYDVLARMGARVEERRTGTWCGEPFGELRIRAGRLQGVRISPRTVPRLLDEIPVLSIVAAGAARGVTRISGAGELRVKECDRLAAVAAGLARLGIDVDEREDGLVIRGGTLRGGIVDARGDHRIEMAFRVADLLAPEPVRVRGASVAGVSHPGFERDLKRLQSRAAGR
jgi:3-phosphoshikimate 1-carboxyvinyltransferase